MTLGSFTTTFIFFMYHVHIALFYA